jgi:16S rRNA processing protein RimM
VPAEVLPFGILGRPHGTTGEISLRPFHSGGWRLDSVPLPLAVTIGGPLTWEPSKGSLRPSAPSRPAPTPLADARPRQTLPRWCAAGEGAREARGVGRVAGRPEVPAGGTAGGLPTRVDAPATITAVRRMADGFLLRLEGFSTREEAASLTGRELWLPRATLPPLGAGDFYVEDMPGCLVEDSQGRVLGVVRKVYWNGAQDIMVIGDGEHGERLLPAVPEFIVAIDLLGKRVVVDPHE